MQTTKHFMRPGEKARLEVEPKTAIDESTIEWKSTGGIVAIDPSEQKTPYDARVIATGQAGIAYVEFSAKEAVTGEDVLVTFEIHNTAAQSNPKASAFARLSRSYRRDGEQRKEAQKSADESAQKAKLAFASKVDAATFPVEAGGKIGEPSEEQKEASGSQKPAASRETDQSQAMRMNSDNPVQSAGLSEKAPEPETPVIEPSPVNDTTTTSLGGTIGSPAYGSGAKPTTTVLGIDTITPEESGDLEVVDTHSEESAADRSVTEEAVQNVRQIDENLQKEADKLPSETELSGTPNAVIIPPVDTVTEDDARRAGNADKSEEAPKESESAESEAKTQPTPSETPKDAKPSSETKEKPAKTAKKPAKKEAKKDK